MIRRSTSSCALAAACSCGHGLPVPCHLHAIAALLVTSESNWLCLLSTCPLAGHLGLLANGMCTHATSTHRHSCSHPAPALTNTRLAASASCSQARAEGGGVNRCERGCAGHVQLNTPESRCHTHSSVGWMCSYHHSLQPLPHRGGCNPHLRNRCMVMQVLIEGAFHCSPYSAWGWCCHCALTGSALACKATPSPHVLLCLPERHCIHNCTPLGVLHRTGRVDQGTTLHSHPCDRGCSLVVPPVKLQHLHFGGASEAAPQVHPRRHASVSP
jgi:hypothetical protein